MTLIRHCEGPGCHEEQEVAAGDPQIWEADRPWLTTMWKAVSDRPLHFCSRACHNLYTAPPIKGIEGIDDNGHVYTLGDDPRDPKTIAELLDEQQKRGPFKPKTQADVFGDMPPKDEPPAPAAA